MELQVVERAKLFWSQVDVDLAFEELLDFLLCLREAIKSKTASDKGYIQGMNIIMESEVSLTAALRNDSFEEVLIGEDILTVSVSDSHCTVLKMKDLPVPEDTLLDDASRNPESDNSQMSSSGRNDAKLTGRLDAYDYMMLLSPTNLFSDDQLAPVSPVQLSYQQHDCSPACLPHLPAHSDHFLGHNPLRVPLICRFQRHCAKPLMLSVQEDLDSDVVYKAPCGRSLCCMDDVYQFLQQTKSLGVLQQTNFSFNPFVLPERQAQPRPLAPASPHPTTSIFERDISRGMEAVPVTLCNDLDGVRPKEFRYRKDRWPHGCFLSKAPYFLTCCDCTDGCADSSSCLCLQLSLNTGAKPDELYRHHRLNEPVATGLYECGPWCGCQKSICQNRVVQHGLRVRLQVFRTSDKGWGVRCCDDLDTGTFICTYAGVVLRLGKNLEEPFLPKAQKEEQLSDDEVEVVEEWTLPSGQKKTGTLTTETLDTSPALYVPVIQRSADQPSTPHDGREQPEHTVDQEEMNSCSSPNPNHTEIKEQRNKEGVRKRLRLDDKKNGGIVHRDQMVRKVGKPDFQERTYYLDGSKEGNVGRFINHSCNPNLFVQNVFVDTHDPNFPVIAFFTSQSITAGTELTWNYFYKKGSDPEHEVPCLCGSTDCQAVII
ncbi:histone-lysine N-methyltransferase SETDB2 [Tachysurus vachellii]|uniref:histone-lysine N-methyltransferase SETDB2 n=1 Tax=Tachysurus vachellii TaxID=175792 RepID=UPI00296AA154|nr:histone-lysine N-methyltransferase SETDB2 [Tachysurus vachellii]XP_060716681.1 histone-lysine N-methyltransferase SETDB2 [Tachysurus vachellii]